MASRAGRCSILLTRLAVVSVLVLLFSPSTGRPAGVSASGVVFAPIQKGDILVALGPGQVQEYDADRNYLGTLTSPNANTTAGMAIDPSGKYLYVASVDTALISVFTMAGLAQAPLDGQSKNGYVSVGFDGSGDLLAGEYARAGVIRDFGLAGAPARLLEFGFKQSSVWFDLASDQTTLYFTTGDRTIYHIDRTNENFNSPFIFRTLDADPNSAATAVRLLPPGDGSGGLLLADLSNIKQFDEKGNLVFGYDVSDEDQWISLSLDVDGEGFWAGSGQWVYHFKLRQDKPVTEFNAADYASSLSQTSRIWGVLVAGEWLAARPFQLAESTLIPTYTASPTASITPSQTSSLTPTFTPTLTPLPAGVAPLPPTFTPSLRPSDTPAPTPTEPATAIPVVPTAPPGPYRLPAVPLMALIVFSALIVVSGGGAWLIWRLVRQPSPSTPKQPVPHQSRVNLRPHSDPGSQAIETASDRPTPQIRLRTGLAGEDYSAGPAGPHQPEGG
jgi:hypothetical protein